MSTPQHIGSAAPFTNYVREYIKKGWDVIPLPPKDKRPPPPGYTGRKNMGRYPTELDLQRWLKCTEWKDDPSGKINPATGKVRRIPPWAKGNIAVHPGREVIVNGMSLQIIGIDIDDYDKKHGWSEVKSLEEKLGPLPDTWTSSARVDMRSGIRWYLVPYGYEFKGKVSDSVEVIQHIHRYGVVFPSYNPHSKTQYYWYEPRQLPNGRNYSDDIPKVESLALLPEPWIKHILKGVRQTGYQDFIDEDISSKDLKQWARDTMQYGSEMCLCTKNHIRKWLKVFAEGGDHHDPLVNGHWNLFALGTEGHTGTLEAVNQMQAAWFKRLDEEGDGGNRPLYVAQFEMLRSQEGALRKLKAAIDSGSRVVAQTDPCTKPKPPGGSGSTGNGGSPPVPPSGPRDLGLGGDDGLPPQGTMVESPSKPSMHADWLLARWEAQGRPVIRKLGEFYQYNGTHWDKLSDGEIFQELYPIYDRCLWTKPSTQGPTPTPWDPDEAKLRRIVHALEAKAPNHDHQKENTWFDGTVSLVIPLRNGLVRVEDKALLPHSPKYFCTYVLGCDYEPAATSPKTDAFLLHLASGDGEGARLLYQWMGYVVAGNNQYQKGLIVKGKSGSGKGVYSRLLDKIVGSDNYAGYKVADFKNNTFAKEPLVGKSLVVFSDNRSDFTQQGFVDLVLEVIGQDATTLRMPYAKKSFSVYLPCRFMILTNLMPSVSDDSGAFVRRFVAVECNEDPVHRISDYETVLFSELSGIVNRMLVGLEQLNIQDGFIQPARSAWILDTIRETSSLEHEFVNDKCVKGPPSEMFRVKRDEVYVEYLTYCSEQNQKPLTKSKFADALTALGDIELHKRGTRKEGQTWYVEGLRLKKASSKLRVAEPEKDEGEQK